MKRILVLILILLFAFAIPAHADSEDEWTPDHDEPYESFYRSELDALSEHTWNDNYDFIVRAYPCLGDGCTKDDWGPPKLLSEYCAEDWIDEACGDLLPLEEDDSTPLNQEDDSTSTSSLNQDDSDTELEVVLEEDTSTEDESDTDSDSDSDDEVQDDPRTELDYLNFKIRQFF